MATKIGTQTIQGLLAQSNHVAVGATFAAGWDTSKGEHTVAQVLPGKMILARAGSGKHLAITFSRCAKVLSRLLSGERLVYQAAPKSGGISFTVAETRGVWFVLRNVMTWDSACERFRLATDAQTLLARIGA